MTDRWGHASKLTLAFEVLRSLPAGVSEVRVWEDHILQCKRVGKRIDLRGMGQPGVLSEPATLQRIKHQNVVPVLAAARVSDYPPNMDVVEIITPYFHRGSITDSLLTGNTFTVREAISITQSVLRGLAVIHGQHGICHRDMKSGNVLLPDTGDAAMVADLGLAAEFDRAGRVPTAGNPTLYSPPEFAAGVLTRTADIYAAGLIFRELLGGPFPYADYDRRAITNRLMKGQPPLTADDMRLPVWSGSAMGRVYSKATRKRPADRYATAAEMDNALASLEVVNWRQNGDMNWSAPFAHHADRDVCVQGRRLKDGTIRLATLIDRGSGPRRQSSLAEADVESLYSRRARTVFDQANRTASAS